MINTAVLQEMLSQAETHPKIKQTIKLMCMTREKVNFHAFLSQSETYLQIRGLSSHDYDEFNYVNKMLYSCMNGVMGKIKRKQISVRDKNQQLREYQAEKYRAENVPPPQMVEEVEHVVNNMDLPISLFKRNDNYWYCDNPRTIEAKEFIHHRHELDRQRKQKIRAERKKKQMQRDKKNQELMEKERKMQEERRKQFQKNANKRIQEMKENTKQREKLIEDSQKFYMALRPKFKTIERDYRKQQQSAVEDQRNRFSELRKLRKSIDMAEIQQHKKKLDELKEEHEKKIIFNEPLKVSFKSKYHTSMTSRSRVSEGEALSSLYEKKVQYGRFVKKQHKPQISDKLQKQIEERLKLLKRRRARKNPKKGESALDQDSENQEEEQKPVKKVKQFSGQDDEQQDDDDQPQRKKGEDQDPDRHERYELGMQYLEYVRNLPKKPKEEVQKLKKEINELIEEDNRRQKEKTQRPRYTNYLKESQNHHKTIDQLDTSKMSYHKSILGPDFKKKFDLNNQTRKVEERAKNEEELIKHRKLKQSEVINRKIQLDNVVVDTIRARLALLS